jgi:hypothetical protein
VIPHRIEGAGAAAHVFDNYAEFIPSHGEFICYTDKAVMKKIICVFTHNVHVVRKEEITPPCDGRTALPRHMRPRQRASERRMTRSTSYRCASLSDKSLDRCSGHGSGGGK